MIPERITINARANSSEANKIRRYAMEQQMDIDQAKKMAIRAIVDTFNVAKNG